MLNIAFRREILKLNGRHQPLGFFSIKSVFTDLANWQLDHRLNLILDKQGKPIRKMLAYDVGYQQNDDGTYDFSKIIYMNTVAWDTWITLPIRSYDLVVNTPKLQVRVPRIVVSLLYEDMPDTKFNGSLNSYYRLYNGRCAYTDQEITKEEASRDHVVPLNKGGANDPSNIVLCHKDLNSKKGDKYNYQCGLPEVIPKVPTSKKLMEVIHNDKNVPEWGWILKQPRQKRNEYDN